MKTTFNIVKLNIELFLSGWLKVCRSDFERNKIYLNHFKNYSQTYTCIFWSDFGSDKNDLNYFKTNGQIYCRMFKIFNQNNAIVDVRMQMLIRVES